MNKKCSKYSHNLIIIDKYHVHVSFLTILIEYRETDL